MTDRETGEAMVRPPKPKLRAQHEIGVGEEQRGSAVCPSVTDFLKQHCLIGHSTGKSAEFPTQDAFCRVSGIWLVVTLVDREVLEPLL